MINKRNFSVPFQNYELKGDIFGTEPVSVLFLHGAGKSQRSRFDEIREFLLEHDISSAAFDFIGHGETEGELTGSSLKERSDQASAVIKSIGTQEPLALCGWSMSGYTAIKLTKMFNIKALVLLVPAVYDSSLYEIPFGSDFTEKIRKPLSWHNSDAFEILNKFTGNLLTVRAGQDAIIPPEVPEKIYASAQKMRSRELLDMPGYSHGLLLQIKENKKDFDFLCNKILSVIEK